MYKTALSEGLKQRAISERVKRIRHSNNRVNWFDQSAYGGFNPLDGSRAIFDSDEALSNFRKGTKNLKKYYPKDSIIAAKERFRGNRAEDAITKVLRRTRQRALKRPAESRQIWQKSRNLRNRLKGVLRISEEGKAHRNLLDHNLEFNRQKLKNSLNSYRNIKAKNAIRTADAAREAAKPFNRAISGARGAASGVANKLKGFFSKVRF